jgi:hypothetical protein
MKGIRWRPVETKTLNVPGVKPVKSAAPGYFRISSSPAIAAPFTSVNAAIGTRTRKEKKGNSVEELLALFAVDGGIDVEFVDELMEATLSDAPFLVGPYQVSALVLP